MSDINMVIATGNLGRDPEMKFLPNGSPTTSFSIGCSQGYKDKDGVWQNTTEWLNIVTWNKLAEKCNQELSKGSKVFIQGKVKTRSWDKDGVKHYRTEIVADAVRSLAGKEAGEKTEDGETEDMPF